MSAGIPYLGSKISLISKSEVRYEGILYTIDTNESTVALAKVRSYGTEDRPTDRPVAPREEVYEYIIFRGSDIKDIRVCQPAKPLPTLQGGLPNDPAIVQHSANRSGPPSGGPFPSTSFQQSTSSAPGSGRPGSSSGGPTPNFGPIGTTSTAPAPAFSGPSAAFAATADSLARQNVTPSMELLGGSGPTGPTVGLDDRTHMRDGNRQRGGHRGGRGGQRGGQIGFHHSTRGRGGGQQGGPNNYNHTERHQYNNYRGGAGNRGRGFAPGKPHMNKKEPLKFDSDYDFEEANEQFKEVLSKLEKTSLDNGDKKPESLAEESDSKKEEVEEGKIKEGTSNEDANGEVFYDKTKSFFDSISCEALERSKGKSQRPDWRAEKKLNKETFGVAGPNTGNWRGRGSYGGRGGRGYYNGGYGGRGQGFRSYGYGGGRFNRARGGRILD